ncbi:MAG: hypothetical protein AAB795_01900 [Patescibacteria group bacterium]
MSIENMSAGVPQESEEEIEAKQRKNDQLFKEQADVRNKDRSTVKKMFGVGKVSGVDMAHEEALRINQLVDEKVKREGEKTSPQLAADEILKFSRKHDATVDASGNVKRERFSWNHESDMKKLSEGLKIAQRERERCKDYMKHILNKI